MAQQIVLAFCGEGIIDEQVISQLMMRIVDDLLIKWGRTSFEVLEPMTVTRNQLEVSDIEELYVCLARKFKGSHAIVVHHDADASTEDGVWKNQFAVGSCRVQREGGNICRLMIPAIPIRETEAWLLCDQDALQSVTGGNALPSSWWVTNVESVQDPKQELNNMIQAMMNLPSRRRKGARLPTYSLRLAQEVSLARLSDVPSFYRFYDRITAALSSLGVISQ